MIWSFFSKKDCEKGLIGSSSLISGSDRKGLVEGKVKKLGLKIKAGSLFSEKDRKRGLV